VAQKGKGVRKESTKKKNELEQVEEVDDPFFYK